MKKYSVSFELDHTFRMIFKLARIEFICEGKEIFFSAGDFCVILSVDFVASRLSRIEKNFGKEIFSECKQRIDEAFEKYRKDEERK